MSQQAKKIEDEFKSLKSGPEKICWIFRNFKVVTQVLGVVSLSNVDIQAFTKLAKVQITSGEVSNSLNLIWKAFGENGKQYIQRVRGSKKGYEYSILDEVIFDLSQEEMVKEVSKVSYYRQSLKTTAVTKRESKSVEKKEAKQQTPKTSIQLEAGVQIGLNISISVDTDGRKNVDINFGI